jgi:hypothetical protein
MSAMEIAIMAKAESGPGKQPDKAKAPMVRVDGGGKRNVVAVV